MSGIIGARKHPSDQKIPPKVLPDSILMQVCGAPHSGQFKIKGLLSIIGEYVCLCKENKFKLKQRFTPLIILLTQFSLLGRVSLIVLPET
jgi:hypothetical protein